MSSVSSYPRIIQLDLSSLYASSSSGTDIAMAARMQKDAKNFTTTAVSAPWDESDDRTTNTLVREAKANTPFIDENADEVEAAEGDADLKTTFTLYRALDRLRILADYAADEDTSKTGRAEANAAFQRGLREVQDYVAQSDGKYTSFQFGQKTSKTESDVVVPKSSTSYKGQAIQKGGRDDVLTGLTGTEKFQITLSKYNITDTVTVDLSTVQGPLTLEKVNEAINTAISSVYTLDESGNPNLDQDGKPISRYATRAAMQIDEDNDWGIAFNSTLLEKVSLSEVASTPSVYVVSTADNVLDDDPLTSEVARYDVGGDPSVDFREAVAAIDTEATKLASDVYEANKPDEDDDLAYTAPEPGDQAAQTTARGIAVDSQGNTYIVGTASGDMDGQQGDGANDLFLTKRDSNGQVIYSRFLGASGTAEGFAVTVDANDNVIVAGSIDGKLSEKDATQGQDTLIVKYNKEGKELFATQLDSYGADGAQAVAVDANGDIYVAGKTNGALRTGLTSAGETDAYVAKLSGSDGKVLSATQYGTGSGDEATGIAIDRDGSVLVTSTEAGHGVVRRLSGADVRTELDRQDLGDLEGGRLNGIAVDASTGQIAVVGTTGSDSLAAGTVNGTHGGKTDGMVLRLDSDLSVDSLSYVGGDGADSLTAVTAANGTIYATGATSSDLTRTRSGSSDSVLVTLDGGTGAVEHMSQIGAGGTRTAGTAIAYSETGSGVLAKLGLKTGELKNDPPQTLVDSTSLRAGDHFYVSVDGGRSRKITVEANDTYKSLANKIRAISPTAVQVEADSKSTGTTLKIEPKDGHTIDIISGKGEKDALNKLGLEPTRLIDKDSLYGLGDEDEEDKDNSTEPGGTFSLKLDASLKLTDETTSAYVKSLLEDAVATTKRAYRSLYFDTNKAENEYKKDFSGEVPAYLTNKIANYQDALARLGGSTGSTGGSY